MAERVAHQPGYKPHIDGLRAIAVVAVVLFHAGFGCPGGFVGVDIFFVISGYLITGLILRDLDRGQFRIADFFERRVRRIFPALAVVTAGTMVAGYFLLLPWDFKLLGQELFAQSISASNFYFYRASGYFEKAAELRPFLHTWSLAVEEQFYLLFALAALIPSRRSWRFGAILCVAAMSLAGCLYLSRNPPTFNFYLLPSRAWELLMGACLAHKESSSKNVPRWVLEALGGVGLLMIVRSITLFGNHTVFPGIATLVPCVGAALILWTSGGIPTAAGRLLSLAPMTFVGAISYSLYLWHWPFIVYSKFATFGQMEPWKMGFGLAMVFLVSVVSWKYVENPFRRGIVAAKQSTVFVLFTCCSVLFAAVGLTLNKADGMPSRLPSEAKDLLSEGRDDYGLNQRYCYQLKIEDVLAGRLIDLGTTNSTGPIEALLWGDSHAAAVIPVMDFLCAKHGVRGVAAVHASTAPLIGEMKQARFALPESRLANESVVEFVRKNRVRNVLLVAKWLGHLDNNSETKLRERMSDTVEKMHQAGAEVWILKQVPKPRWHVPTLLASALYQKKDPSKQGWRIEEFAAETERQAGLFLNPDPRFRAARILDPAPIFAEGAEGRYRIFDKGKALYCDESHLSVAGSMFLRDLFEPIFSNRSPAGSGIGSR